MFAIEIEFNDGQSSPEWLVVRRPFARIGARSECHVIIEDFSELDFELQIYQQGGDRFHCQQIFNKQTEKTGLNDSYDGIGKFNLGPCKLTIYVIDNDLILLPDEALDQAGVRLMRQAASNAAPQYPALALAGEVPIVISFAPGQEVYAGRSSHCLLRFDARDISSSHARFGYSDSSFWVEDLGSTNGSFINGQQVSGRRNFSESDTITLGGSIVLKGLPSRDTNTDLQKFKPKDSERLTQEITYPSVIAASDIIRPGRLSLKKGQSYNVGRDPKCSFWVGAPFVSREHCRIRQLDEERVEITDCSTNGTSYSTGMIKSGQNLILDSRPEVLHFGSGLTLAICFSPEDERKFVETKGSPQAFITKPVSVTVPEIKSLGEEKVEANVSATISGRVSDTMIDDDATLYPRGGFRYYLNLFNSMSLGMKLGMLITFFILVAFLVFILTLTYVVFVKG